MSVFPEPKLDFAIFILRLTAERNPLFWKWISQQKLENQSLQMRLIPGGVKIWKRDFEMQFLRPEFYSNDWPMCAIHFLNTY